MHVQERRPTHTVILPWMSNPMRPLRVKKKQLYSCSKSIVYGEAGPYCEPGLQMPEVQEVVELHVRKSGCAEIKM